MRKFLWGFLARIVNLFVPVKSKHWVFASDYGNMYRESAKYLFEYMLAEHPDYSCTYIVAKRKVYDEIASKGYPVAMNFSFKGIIAIAKADVVFTTQTAHDMLYAFKKRHRRYYYLNHGQSLKRQMAALTDDYKKSLGGSKGMVLAFKQFVHNFFISNISIKDSEFISANSEFFIPFLKSSYGESMDIKMLGMPRNDALFRHEEMNKEKWLEGMEGKFIITYMPTHRKYGKGALTPTPFANRPDVQKWMREHNCILLMKQHPNMASKLKEEDDTDVIVDITNRGLDPQVIIYHSDALISDFSSVWLDYLLLRRPLITYIYDDFENDDAGLNIDIRKDTPGHLCYSEEELFQTLKQIKDNYEEMKPTEENVRKFYKYADGEASFRYYQEISSIEDRRSR